MHKHVFSKDDRLFKKRRPPFKKTRWCLALNTAVFFKNALMFSKTRLYA